MTENELARKAAYRRTLHLLDRWRPPAGVTLLLTCLPQHHRIDVIVSACGFRLDAQNYRGTEQEDVNEQLDFMAEVVLKQARDAYDRHDLQGEDPILRMTLSQAQRRFEEGLEEAMCRGKGGGS